MPTRQLAIAVGAFFLLSVFFSAGAGASSILYRKSGALWVASPAGEHKHRIKGSGGLSNPSQDDRGRIVAQKGVRLYRLDRRGKLLNKPITTAFRTNPLVPSFKGPFFPEVSPNGKLIAYTYSFTESHYDPECDCVSSAPSLNTAYTYSSRFVSDPDKKFGHMRFYFRGSWIGNERFVATTPNLFDYLGNVLNTVAIDPLGGGADSYQSWFTECTECGSIATLQQYPLDEAEFTRKRDKMVVVAGDVNATQAAHGHSAALLPHHRPGRQVHQPHLVAGRQVARLGRPQRHLERQARKPGRRRLPDHPAARDQARHGARLGPGPTLSCSRARGRRLLWRGWCLGSSPEGRGSNPASATPASTDAPRAGQRSRWSGAGTRRCAPAPRP